VAKFKKKCDKNLRKDVVAVAQDYGIAITKEGGKKKTIKELCVEIEIAAARQIMSIPTPRGASPPRTRTPSPVVTRASTPPIIDAIPTGMVPRAVVYALTNLDRDMTKAELLKLVTKNSMVLYAAEFAIKGKSLTKPVLLDRIMAAQILRNMPLRAQEIQDESAMIADKLITNISERVEDVGEQAPRIEDVQVIVEQRISTGEPVSTAAVATEIIAEKTDSSSRVSSSRASSLSSRSRLSLSSSRASSSRASSSRASSSRVSSSSRASSRASSLSRLSSISSSMSRSTMSSVASSVSIAKSISNSLADEIIDKVKDKTDRSSVRMTIDEAMEDISNIDIDPIRLEEVVSDEQAREAVKSVVDRATYDGLITADESDEILRPLRQEDPVAGPSGIRPKIRPLVDDELITEDEDEIVAGPSGIRPSTPIQRQIREQDIEKLLREIQKPEESISNIAVIKHRVFRCLGLVN